MFQPKCDRNVRCLQNLLSWFFPVVPCAAVGHHGREQLARVLGCVLQIRQLVSLINETSLS